MSEMKESAAKQAEAKKLELVAKIRDLKAQIGKVNQDLHTAGVPISTIVSCW